jgi:hypothetical protein
LDSINEIREKIIDSDWLKSQDTATLKKKIGRLDIPDKLSIFSGINLDINNDPFENFDDFCLKAQEFIMDFENFSNSAQIGLFERKGKVVFDLLMGHPPLVKLTESYKKDYVHIPRSPFSLLKEPYAKTKDQLLKKNAIIFDDCIHKGETAKKVLAVLKKIHTNVLCFGTLLILEETLNELQRFYPSVEFRCLAIAKNEEEFAAYNLKYLQKLYKLYPPPLDENHLVVHLQTENSPPPEKVFRDLRKIKLGKIKVVNNKGVSSVGIPSSRKVSVEIESRERDIPKFMLGAIDKWTTRISEVKKKPGFADWYIWGYLTEKPFKCTGTRKCQSELKTCFKGIYVHEDNCLECYQFHIELGMAKLVLQKLTSYFKHKGISVKIMEFGFPLAENAEYNAKQKMVKESKI